ncbi:MAG TPA: polymer-forming cytoskeletal protein, partial [Gemmatimonadota bacterium]|nr:polymer-forming cytoskeletal protein [Gemmatimonadota bacterium]
SGAAAPGTVSVQGPGGTEVTIAPGNLSVDQLTSRLERLKKALGRIGSQAQADAGDLALVVHGDYDIPHGRVVGGNLALLSGDLRLGGEVKGDVLVLDGDLSLEPTAVVHGDVLQVGGDVERHGGRVDGEFLSVRGVGGVSVAPEVPSAPEVPAVPSTHRRHGRGFFGSIVHNVVSSVAGVMGVLTALILLGVVGALIVYFLHEPFEVVSDTARASFGRSFGVGLAAEFLFFPVLLILVAGVITWLVIPFYLLGFGLALLAGYLAVAHATGEVLARQRFRYEWFERLRRSNSYYYVWSGLAVLLLPFAIAALLQLFGGWLSFLRGLTIFVAVTGTWVAVTSGLGAAILTRGGRLTEPAGRARPEPGPTEGGA